MYRILLFWK